MTLDSLPGSMQADSMNLPIPVALQIAALLAGHHAGLDGWDEKYLGPGVPASSVLFSEVFSVKPAELAAHVRAHGWDRRLIRPLADASPNAQAAHADLLAFAGQGDDGIWRCLLPLDPERNAKPYAVLDFASEDSMIDWLVAELFQLQRRFFA